MRREKLVKNSWGEFSHHLAGNTVLAADAFINIHTCAPGALLGVNVQPPQAKTLRPTALPFKVVHQRPVEIPLELPVEVRRAPHLVQVFNQVLGTERVACVLNAVLGDDDGDIITVRPLESVPHPLGHIGDEVVLTDGSAFRKVTPVKECTGFQQVKCHQVAGVIIKSNEVLRAGGFWQIDLFKNQVQLAGHKAVIEGFVEDLVGEVERNAVKRRARVSGGEAAVIGGNPHTGFRLKFMDDPVSGGVPDDEIGKHPGGEV